MTALRPAFAEIPWAAAKLPRGTAQSSWVDASGPGDGRTLAFCWWVNVNDG